MSNNKPLIAAIFTMVATYMLISFAIWELNAKNWEIGARVFYAFWGPIFSVLAYSAVKIQGGNK